MTSIQTSQDLGIYFGSLYISGRENTKERETAWQMHRCKMEDMMRTVFVCLRKVGDRTLIFAKEMDRSRQPAPSLFTNISIAMYKSPRVTRESDEIPIFWMPIEKVISVARPVIEQESVGSILQIYLEELYRKEEGHRRMLFEDKPIEKNLKRNLSLIGRTQLRERMEWIRPAASPLSFFERHDLQPDRSSSAPPE